MLNITAVGNLAADPRSNSVGGTDVTNFRLLVNKKIKDQEYVTAVECAVWGARASVAAQYLTKGDRITVVGDAHAETYERNDGSAGCKIVLRVTDFTLPARPAQQAAPAEAEMAF
jgi:single-stranded DNA-binding protein